MTKFGITYRGYTKDEFGYEVRFQVKDTIYIYEVPFYWMEKINQIARHSEPKALNMAKKFGDLVNTERAYHGGSKGEHDSSRDDSERRPEADSQSSSIRTGDGDSDGQDVAKRDASSTILKARNIVQGARDESLISREKLQSREESK